MTSITSLAANPNTQAAYKQFCKDLCQGGVAEAMVQRKENEILDVLKSHGMIANNQCEDQSQLQ